MRKQLAAVGLAAAMALPLSACGGGGQTYQPAAYGQNGHCYYVQDPYEAQQLINAGLCPSNWTPYPMPLAWHEMYDPYYGSSAYASRYVRPSNKAKYLALAKTFYAQHKSQINALVKQAAYKLKNGKVTHPCAAGPLDLTGSTTVQLTAYVTRGGGSGGGHGGGGGSHGSGSHGVGSHGVGSHGSGSGGTSAKPARAGSGSGGAKVSGKNGKATTKPC